MFTSRIGYKMREYSRVEDDFICYLSQLVMMECGSVKVFLIEPNFLYFEMSTIDNDEGDEEEFDNKNKNKNRANNSSQQIEL